MFIIIENRSARPIFLEASANLMYQLYQQSEYIVRREVQRGFVALVSVLIASALLLLIGIGILLGSVDAARMALGEEASRAARLLADSCAEQALAYLRANLGYGGNETIMVGERDTCTILPILGTGNTDRTIYAEASVAGYVRRIEVDVARINPSIVIRSWRLIP